MIISRLRSEDVYLCSSHACIHEAKSSFSHTTGVRRSNGSHLQHVLIVLVSWAKFDVGHRHIALPSGGLEPKVVEQQILGLQDSSLTRRQTQAKGLQVIDRMTDVRPGDTRGPDERALTRTRLPSLHPSWVLHISMKRQTQVL